MVFGLGFKTRNPDRDRETDRKRFERLLSSIETIRSEIDYERNGLQRRYQSVSADAGFLDDAIGNGEASPANAERIDRMASTMINYERRVAELASQMESLEELARKAEEISARHFPGGSGS